MATADLANPQKSATFKLTGIPKPILYGFLFYIGTLTLTQTVYGWGFMSLRWVGLSVWTLTSVLYWLFNRGDLTLGFGQRGMLALLIFLGASFLSVLMAENFNFSALRWLSMTMLLLNCLVFLRGLLAHVQSNELLNILKVVTLVLLSMSILFPAQKTVYDSPLFRGAMGDPNSLGHVAVIAAILFLQGAIATGRRFWKISQGIIAVLALGILVSSWARSSMMALLVGMTCLSIFFSVGRSLLVKSAIFILLAVILASPTYHSKIIRFIHKEAPTDSLYGNYMVLEERSALGIVAGTVFLSRESLWADSWKGFKERPLLGWGFGLSADSPKTWILGYTAIGMVRDLTNDFLFLLEGCGLVGFFGYLIFLWSILRQNPSVFQLKGIKQSQEKRRRLPPLFLADQLSLSKNPALHNPKGILSGFSKEGKKKEGTEFSPDDTHALFYTLSVSLWVLFLFDGSAFSPGSLISAIFWIVTGAAGAMRLAAEDQERHRSLLSGASPPRNSVTQ